MVMGVSLWMRTVVTSIVDGVDKEALFTFVPLAPVLFAR